MWWSKKDANVMNTRILAIEHELVTLREEFEELAREYHQKIHGESWSLTMRNEFAALHAKLDGHSMPAPTPAKTTNAPLAANFIPSLFEELPDNDPRGLRPEELRLNARYREPQE